LSELLTMSFEIKTDFPGGNACAIETTRHGDQTTIAFTPDPHGGPEKLWFNFKIIRTTSDAPLTIKLLLKYSDTILGGDQPENLRPVIRYAESDWERLGPPEIVEKPDGQFDIYWQIAAPQTCVQVALCFPYGSDELENLLRDTDGYWKHDVIGVGQRGTPLVRFANDYGHLESEKPGLYLLARQHSGETPGSWVLDGFLRRVAELGQAAPLIWAVPLADPDGVHFGDYGKDQFPYDLNRAWDQSAMRHEVLAMQRDIHRWSRRCRPTLAMDFHAPGACESDGLYCFLLETETKSERYPQLHECITGIEKALTPQFASPHFERVPRYKSRWGTPNFSRFMSDAHDLSCISFEVPYALCGEKVLSRTDYREAGAHIATAVGEFITRLSS
jgi:hypothetical protein